MTPAQAQDRLRVINERIVLYRNAHADTVDREDLRHAVVLHGWLCSTLQQKEALERAIAENKLATRKWSCESDE